MMSRLETIFGVANPVALATGSGAPRLGNAIVRALAARGYRTAIHANRSADTAEQTARDCRDAGTDAIAVLADLADEDQARNMMRSVQEHFGRVDLLVNCAAIWKPTPLEQVTADDVREHLNVNTIGTFLCCQQAGLLMVQQESGGAIVNVGDWALDRPYMDYAAYFASKGAIPTMTRDFAIELASRNPRIRVNAVLPGRAMLPEGLDSTERQAAIDGTLLKREGSPQHVADAVIFLAEHEFITGVCLPIDGGRGLSSET
jgi:pteridine reductase